MRAGGTPPPSARPVSHKTKLPPPPPPSFPATIASLALGRFIIMPQQRAAVKKAGLPQQNGKTHEAAGDKLAGEATFALATNDPAGFTLGECKEGWKEGVGGGGGGREGIENFFHRSAPTAVLTTVPANTLSPRTQSTRSLTAPLATPWATLRWPRTRCRRRALTRSLSEKGGENATTKGGGGGFWGGSRSRPDALPRVAWAAMGAGGGERAAVG